MTIGGMEPKPTEELLMDRDLAEISTYCDEHLSRIRKSARQDVETELFLKCRRPQLDAAGFCDAQAALPYLTCMRKTIEGILTEDAARFSKARWLWMLRRVPDPILEGRVSTTRPYVFINEEHFLEVVGGGWEMICRDVLRVIPGATLPKSPAELLAALMEFQPTLWPLSPGPIVRRVGDLLWIDLIACTAVLDRSLEFPIVDGDVGNARADHFEGTTQQTINATSWAPGPELAPMIGRELKKEDGTKLTDIDALGEKELELLLVSCKSMVYSGRYDSGDYTTVRNMRTIAEEAVRWWADVVAYLKKYPKGPNYDFSKYHEIIPIVCTPHVVYVAAPYALRFVEPGLNAVCSLNELRTWLMKN